jgi:peptidoglycan/xylan/chitin deacetylase (PgdA/CDA1 family)
MKMCCGRSARGGRKRIAGIWPILFLLMSVPLPSAVAQPIVTVIDDDVRSVKCLETVKRIADRCNVKVTFAVVASDLKKNPEVAELLRKYEQEGHEVASHSLSHRPGIWQAGKATDIRAVEREVVEADAVFERFGLHPRTFVYPYGNFPSEVRHDIFEVVGRYYPVAFNARGDINLPGKTYPLYVSRHPLRSHNSMYMTKRLIDKAVAAGDSWVVIFTHSGKSDFSAERLESAIRYAQKSGAVFMPASAAWQQASNWPMMSERDIPEYSRFGDYLNAAYFHLPLMLILGTGFVVLLGGAVWILVRRRKKASGRTR